MAENNAVKGIGFLALLSLFAVRACKSCDNVADDAIRGSDNVFSCNRQASKSVDDWTPPKYDPPPKVEPITPTPFDDIPTTEPTKSDDATRFKSFKQNSDNTYNYDGKQYNNFQDIPFQASDNLYLDRTLTSEEARHLISKGVKFVYNNPAYLKQKDKSFKVIYLISDDVELVKDFYELDDVYAKELITYSSKLLANESIIKVSSFKEMIEMQNRVISNNEVPVLIFHNSVKKLTLNRFNPESNFITCNSFEVNTESYLTSIDLLDMRAIIQGLNESYSSQTLEGFYNKFTATYHSHMSEYHKHNTLIYLGGGIAMGGGVFAIAYYNKKN